MNVDVFGEDYTVYRSKKVGFRIFMERVEESAGKWVEGKAIDNGFWRFNVKDHLKGGTIAGELRVMIFTG